jgi:hypothetical protein
MIKTHAGKIEALEKKAAKHDREFQDIQEEYPLLPPEADDLANAVKKKGVAVLGGKKSNAYQNKDLRRRLYMDVYAEIKRQFGLINEKGGQLSYKKLKRKYLKSAFLVVKEYVPPVSISNEIEAENELDFDDE